MGRTKVRFDNVGRMKTTYTVNFDDHQSILDIIEPLMENTRTKKEILKLGLGIIDHIHAEDTIDDGIEHVTKLLGSLSPSNQNSVNVKFLIQTFGSFVENIPTEQQVTLYKMLGEQLNTPLKEQSKETPNLEHVDISDLLKSSSQDMYDQADPRLRVFIEEAVKTSKTEKYGTDVANTKKASFCHNIIENFLKARNLRFVSYAGLGLLTLVYIFSGRSVQTCKLVAATGAKGTHKIVTQFVLPNSRKTSYRSCVDGVTVYYSFDNIQKISKIWRVHGSQQDKSLAKVATSLVHCYPDGLINSSVQYVLRHSPMLWLYKLELNQCSNVFHEKFDKDIIDKILKLDDNDLDIVLGRWDLTVEMAIDEVKREILAGEDNVDKMLEKRKKVEESNVKFCINGHRNEKPRGNQKYCKICKKELVQNEAEDEDCEDDEGEIDEAHDYSSGKYKRLKITQSETGPIEASLVDIEVDDKAKLYPRVRNIFNENQSSYESEGIVYVNPNKFIRVKIVLHQIQKLTKTDDNENTLIEIEDDGSITSKVKEVNNMRTWIAVTLDGLPHKIAIDVIKHCYKCHECGKDFTVINDVGKHFESSGHKKYKKTFGNIILKIGGLHAEMNMLRSFVSLNWPIMYSFLCRSMGFKSPKAQLLQQKVQDMHKSWDTFKIVRESVVKEAVKLFIDYAEPAQIQTTPENFENWIENEVKNPNLKLVIQIQKYFGTSLWLFRAGQRANYFKLYRAALRVFAGLFHINGNLHYSAIEVYDDYLMTSLEEKNEELFDHLQTRLCTNIKQKPFCAQSHDARHEESNKLAQNMFPGKDLDELELAFTIVDDIYALRKQVFDEKGINDRSDEVSVVIPEYRKMVFKMRCDLRESKYFGKAYEQEELRSIDGQALHPNLVDIFEISRQRREADVLNAYRYNDFLQAYNPRSRIAILADDKECQVSEKEVKDEIMILIHILSEDLETQSVMREIFENVRSRDIYVLKNFLDLLVEKDYQTIYEIYK